MICIDHPRARGKPPPVRKPLFPRRPENVKSVESSAITNAGRDTTREKNDIGNNKKFVERENDEHLAKVEAEIEDAPINDYNENIIVSTDRSFEQLRDMISDLEKNITTEIPEIDRSGVCAKYDSVEERMDFLLQLEPEKDDTRAKCGLNGTTYEDIMSFLGKLENDPIDRTTANLSLPDTAILQEIFKQVDTPPCANCKGADRKIETAVPNAFKEDLITAQLQIEEKDAAIVLLKNQLKVERKSACDKFEAQRKGHASKMQTQEDKYKGIVKRHQKFIEQLISEKTDLTEKCNSLAQRVKEMEIKVQRDLKTAADRHSVELQRAREHYAAAEKVKRERWLEARTLKIKEMTVKGLEPELRHMIEQHEEEIRNLRNAHQKDIQETELRVMRRSNQQLEQLRLELTATHEKVLSNEKDVLWTRYKEKLDQREIHYDTQRKKLMEDLQCEKELLDRERAKHDAEKNAIIRQAHLQRQQDVEALKQQHLRERKSLQESLQAEWEAWFTNYKEQQVIKSQKTENKIRDECIKERDKQIELAIGRLEKDSRHMRLTLQQNFDCEFKSLKEKYQMDLQSVIENEKLQKDKLLTVKEQLEKTELQLQKAESELRECTFNLNNANQRIDRLITERDNAKKFVRQEIEAEKRDLEEKIASLYREITKISAERDISMAQVYSRIKLIMTQKMLTIKNLTKELSEVETKCEHLEKLLDQQRKEYILQSV